MKDDGWRNWWCLALTAASLGVGAFLSTVDRSGAQEPYKQVRVQEVVEAEKFVLRDAQGRVRLEIGPNAGGNAVGIRFLDRAGRNRLNLAVADDGQSVGVSLSDGAGKDRVALMLDPEAAALGLSGKQYAGITETAGGDVMFVAGDPAKGGVALGVDARGNPIREP